MDEIVGNSQEVFECQYCGKPYSFLKTVFEYGVMFLIARESGFIGTNCLECSRTNLKKGDRSIIESIKEGLKLKDSQIIPDRPRLV